jgi:hypothetical protein
MVASISTLPFLMMRLAVKKMVENDFDWIIQEKYTLTSCKNHLQYEDFRKMHEANTHEKYCQNIS